MQPFTPEFAKASLRPQERGIQIGGVTYQAVLGAGGGFVEERGAEGVKKFPMAHVMGGKNTYYFLTPMERGRLQVLPVAYDVHKQSWYDMAASGVRMHAEAPSERPMHWTDSAFTFNTSCYSCHVSQLKTNYDVAADTYHSTWSEPGINCETCHGDGTAHASMYRSDVTARHEDMRILRISKMSVAQRNEMCAPCHAKTSPISTGYEVTQRFFDHYDLVTLEDPDYYPDGRDLGENYTYASWLMSSCIRGGQFDCTHCHASSGKFKFADGNSNGACLPCHQDKADQGERHSHHTAGGTGSNCIDCHMPKTRFANMNRTDHSMLPPAPAATMQFQSPNACNLCHKDKPATWADAKVRQWQKRDYQRPVLDRAGLVSDARRGNWSKLPAMLAYIEDAKGDAVTQAGLIRLLRGSDDGRKNPVLIRALKHANPLLRAAAATSLNGATSAEVRDALLQAANDDYRLVRIRAAAALAGLAAPESLRRANSELLGSLQARPDNFANQTNLGNYYLERGELEPALRSFELAIRLRPDSVGTLVNASMAYSRAGRAADAERVLNQALQVAPDNAAANFNRGLLLAEMGRTEEAETSLRKAVSADPAMAGAAYNLCVLLLGRKDAGGLRYCQQAHKVAPGNEKYAFGLAYYTAMTGQIVEATRVLEAFQRRYGGDPGTKLLLGDLYVKSGRRQDARAMYSAVAGLPDLTPKQRQAVDGRLREMAGR